MLHQPGELGHLPAGGTVSSKTSVENGLCPLGDNYTLSWDCVTHTNLISVRQQL